MAAVMQSFRLISAGDTNVSQIQFRKKDFRWNKKNEIAQG